jgi:hypothetical protein
MFHRLHPQPPPGSSGKNLSPVFLRYDTGRIENDASNNSSIVACVFVAAVTFLPSHCLNDWGYIYRHLDPEERDLYS